MFAMSPSDDSMPAKLRYERSTNGPRSERLEGEFVRSDAVRTA